ncbi:hypothetical protein PF005_g4431 [Phytophthora fragariae]|uniref:RxLR effector protein n=2 Tax=Phytophthora TaxID=4783 RepID=A0A6A3Z1Y2_9STRA|nr:hypothetical protein PF003_g5327 [Phytophthora fragariae]KAE9043925.1 hypothetical protein PR002_g3091 [Phytophthora rubi]KAE8945706.1 hypothetical protein PF009_g4664 [Phytophthora fragariae]KAE9024363.1 hypothetical protein PF011_g3546 [Phytophthora fragariae]KAE9049665.1 hypothetical protein PR001_g3112 [Phytophthora rubi]
MQFSGTQPGMLWAVPVVALLVSLHAYSRSDSGGVRCTVVKLFYSPRFTRSYCSCRL